MKKNLYLVGAGDFGLEVEFLLRAKRGFLDDHTIVGFLDDNLNALDGKNTSLKIIGSSDFSDFTATDLVLITLTNPTVKEKVFNKLNGKVKFYTFISEQVLIAPSAIIGEGTIICANSIVSINANIGKSVTINFGSQIGHDATIGDFTSIMCNVDVGGHTKLGKNVFMGSNSAVIQGLNIVENVMIGAGGIVIRNLKKPGTYIGNPVSLLN